MSPKGRVGAGAVSGVVVPEPLRHSGRMRRKPLGRVNRCRAVLKGHRANRIVSSPSDKQSQGTAASAGECRPGEQGDERRRDAEGSNRLLMFAQHLAALGGGAQRRDQDQQGKNDAVAFFAAAVDRSTNSASCIGEQARLSAGGVSVTGPAETRRVWRGNPGTRAEPSRGGRFHRGAADVHVWTGRGPSS